jgi:hypothetical protein
MKSRLLRVYAAALVAGAACARGGGLPHAICRTCDRCRGSDIRRVARHYMKNIQYVHVGDSSRAPAKEMGIKN